MLPLKEFYSEYQEDMKKKQSEQGIVGIMLFVNHT